MIARRLSVRGRVQGVWYRESLRQAAEGLGVAGWVRNRLDGSVEAFVQGDPRAVEALVAWAWQGPPAARVEAVEVVEAEPEPLTGFEKRDTL